VLEIVTGGGRVQMGIVVDSVKDVLDIYEKDVEAAPSFGVEINTEFIHGMAKTDKGVIILLNIDKVLTTDEIAGVFDAGINNNKVNEKEEKNV
jgi:purine-binding chemotaxis protein CheW